MLRCCLAAVLGLACLQALAGAGAPGMLLYRYTDSHGVTVLDRQGVPPEYIAKGYQVLNQQGRVVQVVPPAPTAEELRLKQQAKAQADADAQLLSAYPTLEEFDRIRARKLAEVDTMAQIAQNNINALQAQQGSVQSQAANEERAGRPVPQAMLDQLQEIRQQREGLEAKIAGYTQSRAQVEQELAGQRLRLVELLGAGG